MTNYCLFDEDFIIKSLKIILDSKKIKRVKYHNLIFKVSNVIDKIYDYDDLEKVLNLINNIKEMSGKRRKKAIFEIQTKSGIKFFLDVSKDTLTVGKSIRMKNRVKLILVIAVFIIINYIFRILNI